MATTEYIRIPKDSRYKDTEVFDGGSGREFGLLEPPVESIVVTAQDRTHVVTDADIGALDRVAVLYYGKGLERMWWIVALANRLVDPDRDMFVGQELTIPGRTAVLSFINRVGVD